MGRHLLQHAGFDHNGPLTENLPCNNDTAVTMYLNNPKVKEALHVDRNITWAICSDINYTTQVEDVTEFIQHAMAMVCTLTKNRNFILSVYLGARVSHNVVRRRHRHGLQFSRRRNVC